MKVHSIQPGGNDALQAELSRFEEQFTYPLGEAATFRIDHGSDYTRFFRAMGDANCFVAEADGEVLGTLGTVVRELRMPDGEVRVVGYLADLKVAKGASGFVLWRLMQAAQHWLGPQVSAAFGVTMGGTAVLPATYTGRLGIPAFASLAELAIFRLPVSGEGAARIKKLKRKSPAGSPAGASTFARRHAALCASRFATVGGDAALRSSFEPLRLVASSDEACGMLEDTRHAKRLIDAAGDEMISAHLSSFAYRNVVSGACLIAVAMREAKQRDFPALFVAVPGEDAAAMRDALSAVLRVQCPPPALATVFGIGLPASQSWWFNTAEI